VGNLSFDVTREELIEAFSAAGRVVDAKVPTDRETGRPRGFAFVEFESDEAAQRCIEQLNGRDLKGRPLRVNEAENRPPRPAGAPGLSRPAPSGGFSRPGGGGFSRPGGGYGGGGYRSVNVTLRQHFDLYANVRPAHTIAGVPAGCFAYRRLHSGGAPMTVVLNFTGDPLEIPGLRPGRIVVSTGMDRAGEAVAGVLSLGAHEGVLVEERPA